MKLSADKVFMSNRIHMAFLLLYISMIFNPCSKLHGALKNLLNLPHLNTNINRSHRAYLF